jgi:RNA polymerase sigma factor (TIGR02999 family)
MSVKYFDWDEATNAKLRAEPTTLPESTWREAKYWRCPIDIMAKDPSRPDITAMLLAWRQGNEKALESLIPLLYDELRRLAHARLRKEPRGHILQTTALVHEAYLRLVDINRMNVRDRSHLLAMAARLMRQILVDHARRRTARKRGGRVTMVGLDELSIPNAESGIDVLALDEALNDLTRLDARLCRLVELKYFPGLTAARRQKHFTSRRRLSNGTGRSQRRGCISDCRAVRRLRRTTDRRQTSRSRFPSRDFHELAHIRW